MLCLRDGEEVSWTQMCEAPAGNPTYDHGLGVIAPFLSITNDGIGLATKTSPYLGGTIVIDNGTDDFKALQSFELLEQWIQEEIAAGKDPTVIINFSRG